MLIHENDLFLFPALCGTVKRVRVFFHIVDLCTNIIPKSPSPEKEGFFYSTPASCANKHFTQSFPYLNAFSHTLTKPGHKLMLIAKLWHSI
jgi:hypothetical protein